MSIYDYLQVFLALALIAWVTPPLGKYIYKVYQGEAPLKFLRPIELGIYKLSNVEETAEMTWQRYSFAVAIFSVLSLVLVYLVQVFQHLLPFNPAALASVRWDTALNTAISFVTNTNWQSYAGEVTLSYFSQAIALCSQNFLSAAVGMAVLVAFIRGLTRVSAKSLGNFWVDLTRGLLYILLPLSLILALALVSQGVVQNYSAYTKVQTLEAAEQIIPQGPAASQIAIKQLGTNGGGFFNANSAHPYENPTPLSNLLEMLALILIPSALTYTFGLMVGNRKQGWVLWAAMMLLLVGTLAISLWSEYSYNPVLADSAIMEGKETRFGVTNSIIWSVFTTAASNGSVNAMHSSLSPISGAIALLNMMLGEIVFGGVGSGLYGMIFFAILTVFLAGLMVGRTPEYLGKKIEARDIQLTIIAIILPSALVLLGTAVSLVLPIGLSSLSASGVHGLSEILYAFTSAANNNGSAFAGLSANTPYYNLSLGFCMLVGRFALIFLALAIAGNMASKRTVATSPGTFTTDNPLFLVLLIAVIILVGALTFFPVLALGPILEQLLMLKGVAL